MSKPSKSVGRAYLVGKLMACGYSRRQSVVIVNVILERMIRALERGRTVEFGNGKLRRVKLRYSQWWEMMRDSPADRPEYTIEWEPDLKRE